MKNPCPIHVIRGFHDYYADAFEAQQHKDVLQGSNVIICASTTEVAYPLHWTPLSIKCAFHGQEKYVTANTTYSVHDNNYLIFNEDKMYSSHILSDIPVESFTLSFHAEFVAQVLGGLLLPATTHLDNPDAALNTRNTQNARNTRDGIPQFMERLYPHDDRVTPVLMHIRSLLGKSTTRTSTRAMEEIEEAYPLLLERMCLGQQSIAHEIAAMKKVKAGTKAELYKRLHWAKDFMDSCYEHAIELGELAEIACLSPHYFLRQFKRHFGVTPYQYVIHRRLEAAKLLMETSEKSITEICIEVGYNDISSFGRLFKSRYRSSPEHHAALYQTKYRTKYRTKKSIFAQSLLPTSDSLEM